MTDDQGFLHHLKAFKLKVHSIRLHRLELNDQVLVIFQFLKSGGVNPPKSRYSEWAPLRLIFQSREELRTARLFAGRANNQHR
jgi:hypothetical protein